MVTKLIYFSIFVILIKNIDGAAINHRSYDSDFKSIIYNLDVIRSNSEASELTFENSFLEYGYQVMADATKLGNHATNTAIWLQSQAEVYGEDIWRCYNNGLNGTKYASYLLLRGSNDCIEIQADQVSLINEKTSDIIVDAEENANQFTFDWNLCEDEICLENILNKGDLIVKMLRKELELVQNMIKASNIIGDIQECVALSHSKFLPDLEQVAADVYDCVTSF